MKKWIATNYDGTKCIIEWDSIVRFYPHKYYDVTEEYHKTFKYALSYENITSKTPIWIPAVPDTTRYARGVIVNKLTFPKESNIDFKLTGKNMTWKDEPVELK